MFSKRGLAGARAARHQDVEPRPHHRVENLRHLLRQRPVGDQVLHPQRVDAEAPDGERRPVQRERGDDDVDAGAVRQPGVDKGRGLVDPPPHLGDDPFDDRHQVVVVLEGDLGLVQLPVLLDVNLPRAVDHDVGDLRILEQRLQGPKPKGLVLDLEDQPLPLYPCERNPLGGDETFHDGLDDPRELLRGDLGDGGEVQPVDELAVDAAFELLVGVHLRRRDAAALREVSERRGGTGAGFLRSHPFVDRHLTRLSAGKGYPGFPSSSREPPFSAPGPSSSSAIRSKLFVTSLSGAISERSLPRLMEEITVG